MSTSNFQNWSTKMLVNNSKPVLFTKTIEPEIDLITDFDAHLKSLVDVVFKSTAASVDTTEIKKFTSIYRTVNIKKVMQKVNKYDTGKKIKNTNYKSQQEAFKTEVGIADQDYHLDLHLDNILQKKLDLETQEEKPTDKIMAEIQQQTQVANARQDAYAAKTAALRNLIKQHDDKRKILDPEYKNFNDVCLSNEVMEQNDYVVVNIEEKAPVIDHSYMN